MKFRTEYFPKLSSPVLSPEKTAVLAGSCFSQNISAKMSECLWENINPASTLYNPVSIGKALDVLFDIEEGEKRFEDSLFFFNNLWSSHLFDSSFSSAVREECVEEFRIRQKTLIAAMNNVEVIIVTFGTSICYHLVEDDEVVGNCHKQPSDHFYRKRLGIEEIEKFWSELIKKFSTLFPHLSFIFTVSPVRHLKDGFSGNSRSKAVLLLAVEEICNKNSNCFYFPAFEIINDDLRDYRFYAEDLVHPSDEGIEYVWEKFRETFLDEKGNELLTEGSRKYKSAHHRPKCGALGKTLEKGTHP